MKPIPYFTRMLSVLALLALASLCPQLSTAQAQGTTAFTYQGRLNAGTNAATGSYDMTFAVYDANVAGNLIAGPITNSAVAVSNGLFTVTLDFGPGVFTGTNYWVQMAVSPAGANTFTALVPRQQLTPTPYALSLVSPQATALNPAGAVVAFAGPTNNLPNGYLFCDGSAVSRTTYASLFAAIGTAWGTGDGSTTFNLPDMRGVFLRGVNGTRSDGFADPGDGRISIAGGNTGNAVGSYQADMFASHQHATVAYNGAAAYGSQANSGQSVDGYGVSGSYPLNYTAPTGGSETRPKNAYVNYIIKY
jgi:microcystin-dependent protein